MAISARPPLRPRPLSPHLQIYRPQISSILSVFHRATGLALCAGMAAVAWWLIAAASGPEAYECFQSFAGSIVGQIMLIGWAWSLYYHTLAGIRHLFWDMGYGYELAAMTKSGWMVIGGSLILTAMTWWAA